MPSDISRAEVDAWLAQNGWFPGRDVADQVREHVAFRLRNAEEQGFPLARLESAMRFVNSFGLLTLPYPAAPEIAMVIKPDVGYRGDAEDFAELAGDIGRSVFPVGYETSERGIVLVDETGRFFYLHETGPYFLGDNEFEAFAWRLSGRQLRDAEDYYV
ncbi:SUKH-3 domain-containing protein [Actinacidiphila glaucinigra]|uniref:SUKH-3 domain-containing protein n=1 Tax=Actinacidiphila glaucinigra TaxID=235986 RepID=UPI002DD9891F|nr:SUKH-3 domain-containing protein [Actinacidiphila glaucinigra]WSD61967.1 SUKH-3 domain-containing protein [Actinacidiphila glaucinigra]